jgi:hypothetical protein
MTAAQAEALVALHAPRMIRDAEALLAAVALSDTPAGVAVLPQEGMPEAAGVSFGSGAALSLAHGGRPGSIAVTVAAASIVRDTLNDAPADPGAALDVARGLVEHVAAHELAHALTHEPDAVDSAAVARAMIEAARKRPGGTGAAAHGPTWAAALVILTGRVVRLRPAHERLGRLATMRSDLALHGIDAAAVADAVGAVPDAASVREVLAPGGAVSRRLVAAVPDEAERQALIEHRRQHWAAGGVAGDFSERMVG